MVTQSVPAMGVVSVEIGQDEDAVRPQDPTHLGQQIVLRRVVQVVQHQAGEHPVDRAVRVRQLLGEPSSPVHGEPGSPGPAGGASEGPPVRIETGQVQTRPLPCEGDEQVPGPASDVNDPHTGLGVREADHQLVQPADPEDAVHHVVERGQEPAP